MKTGSCGKIYENLASEAMNLQPVVEAGDRLSPRQIANEADLPNSLDRQPNIH